VQTVDAGVRPYNVGWMWTALLSRVVLAGFLAGTAAYAQTAKPTASAADIKRADQLFRSGSAAFAAGNLSAAHSDFAGLVRLMPRIATAHTASVQIAGVEPSPRHLHAVAVLLVIGGGILANRVWPGPRE